jgi:hypothetical protein
VELLVAGSLTTIAVLVIVVFSIFSSRTLLAASNRMDLEANARTALDTLTREIRSSIEVTECKANSITLHDFNKKGRKFEYDSKKRRLTWGADGKADVVLLNDCDEVIFSMFARTPTSGNYDLIRVTDASLCKAVNVSVRCSRTFVAPGIQAMNALSSTIVLRMK